MSVLYSFVIICLFGSFDARHTDIDINRVKLVPREDRFYQPNTHGRRSVNEVYQYHSSKEHDFDDRRSRLLDPRPTMHLLHHPPTHKEQKTLKLHQPREDPRLFYQSDEYLKEMAPKDLNNEVSYVYPGREVIRAQDKSSLSIEPRLDDSLKYNVINSDINPCVRCPHDRTLIAKAGTDRVVLQYPRLHSCAHGRRLPRNVRFIHMYGPNFGSLLEQGSHVLVGKIAQNHKTLQICKMQISVVAQACAVPKSLITHCDAINKNCTFTCRDPMHALHGHPSLTCEDGKIWSGALPVCKARTWCEPLLPPDHGHISCKGATTDDGAGLLEGSSCRVRCQRGWKWTPRGAAVCRRGAWTHDLVCQPKRI